MFTKGRLCRRQILAAGFALVTGMVVAQAPHQAEAADKLRVGFAPEPYPPFWSKDAAGTWTGFEVDLIAAIMKQMGRDYELVPIAWDGIIPALNENKIDVIFNSMGITPERQQAVDFSDKYYETAIVFVGPKSDKIDISKDGLKGKIVGVQTATAQQNWVQKNYGDVVEIKAYEQQDQVNADLAAGRIDLDLADSIALIQGFLTTAQGKDFEVKGDPIVDPTSGANIGAAVRKGDPLKDEISAAIKAIRADGVYKTINDKYFNFDIYGK
ncbi:transporter substrate-binding domain-containing protein [Dongia soli]|uniref:Transporter substrate-binding domain-containing protein n=1 Tax=Dongia soli TaxID=600628 RepID=A0ABU5E535_9PROT|nr:transporter substrate-binding domain-containing protein [Dongia soli]MDY0881371.1 transporter substrate-binding domain-containing protein [Dongia soli]